MRALKLSYQGHVMCVSYRKLDLTGEYHGL